MQATEEEHDSNKSTYTNGCAGNFDGLAFCRIFVECLACRCDSSFINHAEAVFKFHWELLDDETCFTNFGATYHQVAFDFASFSDIDKRWAKATENLKISPKRSVLGVWCLLSGLETACRPNNRSRFCAYWVEHVDVLSSWKCFCNRSTLLS